MPRVPTVNGQSVQSKAAPTVYQQANAPAAAFGAAQAQAMQQAGDSLERTGNILFKRANEMQEQEDASTTMNAYSKASREMNALFLDPEKGVYATRGSAAFAAPDQAEAIFKTKYEEATAGLTSDRQRTAFDKLWNQRYEAEMKSVKTHVLTQREKYDSDSSAALVQTAYDDAVSNRTNPDVVANAMGVTRVAILADARSKGQSPDVVSLRLKSAESNMHKGIISALVDEDPIKAKAYYDRAKGSIRAEDQDGIEHLLKPAVTKRTAQGIAADIVKSGTEIGPDGDALWTAQTMQESGGKQFAKDGTPLTSSAGAVGVAQVMPATAKETAEKHGISWDENKYKTDKAYNESLGKAYMADQMKEFGGNRVLALAAYNAGPGNVQKWIKEFGDPRTGAISSAEWAEKIPFEETRGYVANITAAADRLAGKAPGGQQDEDAAYSTWLAKAEDIKDPDLKAEVQRNLAAERSRRSMARSGDERAAKNEAYDLVNQGKDIPAALANRMEPSALNALNSHLDRVRNGQKTKTDPAVMYEISRQAIEDPETFARRDLLADRAKLDDGDWNTALALQRSVLTKDAKSDQSLAGQRTRNMIVDDTVKSLGLHPGKKTEDATKVGALEKRLDEEVAQFTRDNKKAPNSLEIQKMVDGLIIKTPLGSGWFGTNVGRTEKFGFEMTVADIPKADLEEFRSGYEKHLGKKPSDAEVVTAYNKWVQSNNIR